MSPNHLYLVDGSSYIFRAYHRLPPLTNRHGVPAGAVYGYTTMLWKLIAELHGAEGPTHLAVILDASSHTFRNEMYDQYKAHRPPPPEDLVPQFPLIREATRAFSVPCIETEGLEADDIIACYSTKAIEAGWKVTIVSSDKDLMQLIVPGLDMLDTMNDRRIGPDYVVEKFGVGPDRLGDVLALMGDSVDNVPGVPGIGPKTASQLIQQFGDLETVLASTDQITKPKLKQSLIDHAEMARLSRRLVTLECNAPLPQPLEDLALQGIPPAPLRAFLEEMGFRSLLTKLGDAQLASPAPSVAAPVEEPSFDHDAYETVVTVEALDRWIAEATRQGFVAVDTETDALDAVQANLVGISLATASGKACYIPIGHVGDGEGLLAEPAPEQLPRAVVLAKLAPLLADPAVLKIGQNLKYDWLVFRRAGLEIAAFDDTMLLSFDLDAGQHGHGMDELSKLHLDHTPIAFKDVCGTGKSQISFDRVPLDRATRYAAEDADVTLRLWQRLKPRLAAEAVTRVYEMVDRPLVPVVATMEREGILVDRVELSRLSADYAVEIARLEGVIHEAAGGPFTIGSPKQLGEVLFERLGLKGGRKGKSGVYSTDVTEMERLAADGVEVARLVLEWRQLSKLKSTYTDALQQQINPETGRVHTSFSLAVAQTGRLSSTDPNLQNIPIRTELGRRIRDAFVAAPGNVILSADYSQIELRLAAHMANVPELREAFATGADIHNLTAQELFGEVNRDTRGRAKTINFAILYGISAFGLAGRLGVDRGEAQSIIDRYFARFPGVSRYIADTITQVREQGHTTTLFGRKTWLPGIKGKTPNERQAAERQAINAPIQGTSADLIKRAMIRMMPALAEAGLPDVKMLLQVHDELVFELPAGDVDAATAVIRRVMEGAAGPAITLSVPLGVEIGTGASWGGALSDATHKDGDGPGDIAQLAKGGRTNFFGFLLRLAARLPFLFIAGRWYGADVLGRFAYATIIVEFAAQLATLGLKRGLAQQLAKTRRPHVHVVWDGLLVGALVSVVAAGVLMLWPVLLFPNSEVNGFDWLLPVTVFAWTGSDIALAGLAYRGNIGATVTARSLVEPWAISIAAFGFSFYSLRDGLILSYALSAIAALATSIWPLLREYGRPSGWRPEPSQILRMMKRNLPLAGADAIEWGSRRLDIAILGLFFSPAIVGIYYVAQQVASLPQKLKTSFDPILGPVITQNLAEGNKAAVARQVRQVGFWIIAAQVGIALALGIPGEAVMGLVGPRFVGGTGALAVLLAAEAIAATAVVSEAALIYVAAKRNLAISVAMIVGQTVLSVILVHLIRAVHPVADIRNDAIAAAGPAIALMLMLGAASIAKARLLRRLLKARVSGWRWPLVPAAAAGTVVGVLFTWTPEWMELAFGVAAILAAYGAVIWYRGFGEEDRILFSLKPGESAPLPA